VIAYALSAGKQPEVRRRQVDLLRRRLPADQIEDLLVVLPALDAAPREARLPLMDVAVGTLRRLSHPQFESFLAVMEALARADDRLDLSELAMRRAVTRHVAPAFGGRPPAEVRFRSLRSIATEVSAVLSALARSGQREAGPAQEALSAAAKHLEEDAHLVRLLPEAECTVETVERALDQAALASPRIKKRLIAAATACVMFDRKVTLEEAELLRAFGDALDLPVPPFVPGAEI
jgi:hypothetical protein